MQRPGRRPTPKITSFLSLLSADTRRRDGHGEHNSGDAVADLPFTSFLAQQLDAAGTPESVNQLLHHLVERGLVWPHKGGLLNFQLSWANDHDFVELVASAGIPAPCCHIAGHQL